MTAPHAHCRGSRFNTMLVWMTMLVVLACSTSAMAACARTALAAPGPHAVGVRNVTVTRPNSTTFTATLYYPATAAGSNTPLDPAGAPYPAITFGHGFLQAVSTYASTLQHLAGRGYLIIASQSESGLFPSHANFALDLRHCLTWLEQQHAEPSSFLFGAVNVNAFGASGHSMGGGASILAAAADTRIGALAPLAPANTNPSSIAAAASVSIPTCLIAGTLDTITPTSSNAQQMYNNLAGARQLASLDGGFHCGFQDSSGFGCDSGSMPRATQLELTRGLLTAFFDLHLKGDDTRWRCVWGPERDSDPRVIVQSDARFTLTIDPAHASAAVGSIMPFTLTLANGSAAPAQAFTFQAEGCDWPTTIDPDATAVIPPGDSTASVMSITSSSRGDATQTVLVSARSAHGVRAFALATVQRRCAADISPPNNGDGQVNVNDLLAVIAAWGPCADPGNCPADISPPPAGDGMVNVSDLLAVIAAWGPCP